MAETVAVSEPKKLKIKLPTVRALSVSALVSTETEEEPEVHEEPAEEEKAQSK